MSRKQQQLLLGELGRALRAAPPCDRANLPRTRAPSGSGRDPACSSSFLPVEERRFCFGENDAAQVMIEANATYRALLKSLLQNYSFAQTRPGSEDAVWVETHFDSKTQHLLHHAAHQEVDGRSEQVLSSRPDAVSLVAIKADGRIVTRSLSATELKSLSAAPDAVFEAIDGLAPRALRVFKTPKRDNEDDKVAILVEERPSRTDQRLRPLQPKLEPARGALLAAGFNIVDLIAYCVALNVSSGVFTNLARHLPITIDRKLKVAWVGQSSGHRTGEQAIASPERVAPPSEATSWTPAPQPEPSLLFLRAALDVRELYRIEVMEAAAKAQSTAARQAEGAPAKEMETAEKTVTTEARQSEGAPVKEMEALGLGVEERGSGSYER